MSYETDQYEQRDRSPRRRSRSPRRSRRSYSPRSRSRSRGDREEYRRADRRSRSPNNGAQQGAGGYQAYGAGRGAPARSVEGKDVMMQSIRDSSQQDRRVYVGNLSYDVKWHHLKDFMRQGTSSSRDLAIKANSVAAGEVLFADVLLLPNGMSKVWNEDRSCT
jgi:hypothetical protein